MTIQEKFDGYVTLRQIHRQVFQALEEYRRQHVDFRFAVRKKDKENKLSCGLIFPGNNAYIEVGLSNERDVMNKTSTVFLMFSIQNNSVSAISLNVAYSALTDNDIQKVEKYAGLCRIFNCEPRFVGNNRRIRTSVAIPMNGGDWRQTLQEWLSQNFSVLTRELDGVCLSQDEFDEMLENQVNRGILRRDDDGYSVNEQYVPKSAEVADDGQEREDADDVGDEEDSDEIGGVMMEFGKNLIVFGAPGTGKSYKLNKAVNQWFVDAEGNRFERVTFYPTYSYAQFVGTYKPVMRAKPNGAKGEEIAYEFVPGPFLRVLVKALNEAPDAEGKKKDWCLVVEEINRANAAAVFGDVFQLLDRDANGVSEYAIAASEDVKKYLDKELTEVGKNVLNELTGSIESLRIPANMYIWATMNSADQGVFPMDTAFKRRWEFDNIGIDDEANGECSNWTIEGKEYKWNEIRRYINGLLAEHDVNEDKFMGPYFIKANSNNVVSKKMFASKVLMYLWEDAGRMIRRNLFGNNIKTYSKLVETWECEDVGVKVFEQCNKKENLSADLKVLYANWTMPPPAEQNS